MYELVRAGEIPSLRVNGAIFVPPKTLRAWLQSFEGQVTNRLHIVQTRPAFMSRVVVVRLPKWKQRPSKHEGVSATDLIRQEP